MNIFNSFFHCSSSSKPKYLETILFLAFFLFIDAFYQTGNAQQIGNYEILRKTLWHTEIRTS